MDPGVKNGHMKACTLALYSVASSATCSVQHLVLPSYYYEELQYGPTFRVANFDEFLLSGSLPKLIPCYLPVEQDE